VDRRTFLALLAAPALAQVLSACGDDGDDGGSEGTAPDGTLLRSDIARAAGGDPAAAVRVINAFGADLYGWLTRDDGNIVISPASVAVALAMTREGARGTTATEMDTVLHNEDPAGLASSMNGLTTALEARSGTFPAGGSDEARVELSIANSLWGQEGVAFEQPFLDVLAAEYAAGVRVVDYEDDPEAARTDINAWVAEETADRIPDLIPEGVITQDTRLTLVNAVYLLADWALPFTAEATADGPFTLADDATVTVPFMHQEASFPYAEGDGWQAVQLPYAGEQLAMLVLVPEPGGLGVLEDSLAAGFVDEAAAALAARQVILTLPKWDTESKVQLRDALSELGMPTAFTDAADLSGMTSEIELAIQDVVHQANITVDEKGTEAAAATAVVIGVTSAPVEEPVEVTADRPFVFALRDIETGAILFLGRIVDPSAA
jgi:serpin B